MVETKHPIWFRKKLADLLILSLAKKNDREIRWKKTKNGFYHHGQIIAWC